MKLMISLIDLIDFINNLIDDMNQIDIIDIYRNFHQNTSQHCIEPSLNLTI